MSIKPIDLQTLFVKMGEVSKEQSLVKEQSTLQQAQAARVQVAKELEEDRRVTEAPEESDLQGIKDDEGETKGEKRQSSKDSGELLSEDSDGREVVTDPQVGRHIDLTG